MKALLQWREDEQRNGKPSMNKEEEVELIKVGGQQLLKTALGGADGGETPSESQQVQGRNIELQRLLQDEQLAKESQMQVQTVLCYCGCFLLRSVCMFVILPQACHILALCLSIIMIGDTSLREPVKGVSDQNIDAWALVSVFGKLVGTLFHFSNTGIWKDFIV